MKTETKAKHTPGPWAIYHNALHNRPTILVVKKSDESAICESWGNNEEAKANACLIATAPELLETCKNSLLFLHAHCEHTRESEKLANTLNLIIRKAD